MKMLIVIFLTVSIKSFAALDLCIRLENVESGLSIDDASIHLGYKSNHAVNSSYKLYDIDKKLLFETLFISHFGYKFESKPLIEHHYEIRLLSGKPTLFITIKGIPYLNQYPLNVPVANSSRIKMPDVNLSIYIDTLFDSIELKLVDKEHNEIVKFNEINRLKGITLYRQKIAFRDLRSGFYQITYNGEQKLIPFRVNDYTQSVYLDFDKVVTEHEKMALELLIENHDHYLIQIEQLQDTIASLKRDIYLIKNGPQEDISPIVKEREIYIFVDQRSSPPEGMQVLLTELRKVLMDESVKFSGSMEVKLMVSNKGDVSILPMHYREEDKHILNIISKMLNGRKWQPAMQQGKYFNEELLLYLNFCSHKKAIN